MKNNYIIYYIGLLATFILWIMTISSITITEIYSPFHIFNILPSYYWAGISILIIILILKYVYNLYLSSYLDYVLIVLFVVYLYGTSAVIIENPRFMDVYMHGGFALNIVNKGHIEGSKYLEENPLAFIWFAIFKSITQLHEFVLLKINGVLLPLFVAIIFYNLGKYINIYNKQPLIISIAFIGLFFIDQGHFSPQMIALIFVILIIYLWIYYKDKLRPKLIYIPMLILLIISIVFTNVTTTLAVNIILTSHIIVNYLLINRNKYKKIIYIPGTILLLSLTIILIWLLYIGYRTLNDIIYRLNDLYTNITSLSDLAIQTNIMPLYFYFNLIQYLVAISVIVSGSLLIYILIKKSLLGIYQLGSLIFLTFLVIIPIVVFQIGEESSTFLQRTYMYMLLGWSLIINIITSKSNPVILRYAILGIIILSIMLFPITKYGGDFANYVPSSLLYTADLLTTDSSLIITSSGATKHPFIYESFKEGTSKGLVFSNLNYYNYKVERIEFKINHILAREIKELRINNIFIVIAERDITKYSLIKSDPYFISVIKEELSKSYRYNKIVDSMYNKVYYQSI